MTIQDWGAVGEIIGGLAVLITVLYLVVQLKQNARATHRQTYNSAAEAMSGFSMALARDAAINRTYRAALQNPETLSYEERVQGFAVLDAYFSPMESYYLHNTIFGEDLSQRRWGRTITSILGTPGGKQYWQEKAWQYHDEFVVYIDGLTDDPQPAGSAQ